MKLFLLSVSPSEEQVGQLAKMANRSVSELKIAIIENASDTYSEERKKDWAYNTRRMFVQSGCSVDLIDLNDAKNKSNFDVQKRLKDSDVIWIAGGNTYYVRWLLKNTGVDEVIANLVKGGKIYGGDSAGAILACSSIDGFQQFDDISVAPEVILTGFNFTQKFIIPHWNNGSDDAKIKLREAMLGEGFSVVTLSDGEGYYE